MRPLFAIALGLVCAHSVALATNGSFRLLCTDDNQQTSVVANVVLVQKDLVAALIPYAGIPAIKVPCKLSVLPSGSQDQTGEAIPCSVLPYRSGMGLTLFRLSSASPEEQIVKTTRASDMTRGEEIVFYDNDGNAINGVYIGEEHYHSGISFIIPLYRVQFPTDTVRPVRGQACFTSKGAFVGFVMTSLSQNTGSYYLLPAEFVTFFAQHPEAGRVRLGFQMDVNCSTPEVVQVVPGSPMDRAGIRPGDIITSFNGKTIRQYSDFLNAVHYIADDKPIRIEVIRGTKRLSFDNIVPVLQR